MAVDNAITPSSGQGGIPSSFGRTRRNASQRTSWFVWVTAAILFLLVVPPFIQLINTSVVKRALDGTFTGYSLENFFNLFGSPQFSSNALNSTIFACGSAVFAIILGVTQAWIVERTNTPLRKFVFLFSVISLGIPDVLYTVSWILFFGKVGPFNSFIQSVFGTDGPLFDVYSMWGMILIEGVGWAPLAYLLMSSVFTSIDASFEEASTMSGARIGTTIRRVTLPLARPAVLAVALLIFIRTFEAFEVPVLVGIPGNVNVLTTAIYSEIQRVIPPNHGQAAAFSIGLMLIVIGLLYVYGQATREAKRFQTITGKGYRPRIIDLGPMRYVAAGILVLFFFFLIVVPMSIIIWTSFLPYYQPFSAKAFSVMTLVNYEFALTAGDVRGSIVNTLYLGVGSAVLAMGLAVAVAWFSARRYRGGWLLDQLATIPIVFPSIVLGVALLMIFLRLPIAIYGTILSIIIGTVIRMIPYGIRYAYAGIMQVQSELEEASAMSGARSGTTFFKIILPLLAPVLATGALFIFLMAVRSLSLPLMLAGPRTEVLSVTLYTLWSNGQLPRTAAIGVLWTIFMMIISVAFNILSKRSKMSV